MCNSRRRTYNGIPRPDLFFYVTRIGCGIAGFRDEEIAPLFAAAREVGNIFESLFYSPFRTGKSGLGTWAPAIRAWRRATTSGWLPDRSVVSPGSVSRR